jgi:hypothetical protein
VYTCLLGICSLAADVFSLFVSRSLPSNGSTRYNIMTVQGQNTLCGGGFQYLHRSHESRRRRRKGNPVPGGITGPPYFWAVKIRGPGPPGWGSLEFETVNYGHESRGIRTREWLPWRRPAVIVKDRTILSSERMLHKDYDRKCSVEKENWSSVSRGLVPGRTEWR